ncbi:MAG: NAD-dependent epimerase/dehydratase family protein [Deltaproteobacteria bacterium]|nr:MAG: NAD-dependent epimerase/dehydratase family protein [Deltaproteobacteria bacterium]
MSILVTGGTGFLGRHVVRALLAAGEAPKILVRNDDAELSRLGAEVIPGSVLIRDDVARALRGVRQVFHLAGFVSRDRSHGRLMYEVHVEGSRNVLEAAAAAGVERVVVASTSGTVAVSPRPDPLPTERDLDPIEIIAAWPYYLSKLYQERLCFRLGREHGIEVVAVNPSLLLGPGDRRLSSVSDVKKIVDGALPAIPPGGLSFADVRDVAQACLAAMERGRPGERYLLGAANMSFTHFVRKVAAIAGVEAPPLKLPEGVTRVSAQVLDRLGGIFGFTPAVDPVSAEMSEYYWYLDDSKARAELGWAPRDPHETLADTVADLERHLPSAA